MTETKNITFDDAVEAARQLPEETQQAIAHELTEWIEDYALPPRDPRHQALVEERIAKPRRMVSRDDFMVMLRRYDPSL